MLHVERCYFDVQGGGELIAKLTKQKGGCTWYFAQLINRSGRDAIGRRREWDPTNTLDRLGGVCLSRCQEELGPPGQGA